MFISVLAIYYNTQQGTSPIRSIPSSEPTTAVSPYCLAHTDTPSVKGTGEELAKDGQKEIGGDKDDCDGGPIGDTMGEQDYAEPSSP